MPNRSTDALFQLIKSLEKSEKRNFKLYVNRNSSTEDLKTVQLFDALDKMENYDEPLLLKKNPEIRKQQLSNIKASLYRQILSSLRLIKDADNIDIQLNELMGFARILYNKGLYLQSLKTLEKLKEIASEHNQVTFMQQALFFEKKIEMLHITRSMQDRAEKLTEQADYVNKRLNIISQLSDLSLLLYSWYIKNGHARNEKDEEEVDKFFERHLINIDGENISGFYGRLYWYQSNCWKGFIKQNFLQYYRYTQKWFDLFEDNKKMIPVESIYYLKAMHNLLSAHFALGNRGKFAEVLKALEEFAETKEVVQNANTKIQTFIYLYTAKINKHFMEGNFTEGLYLVQEIEDRIEEYELQIDRHRILVLYYKIACLYFGSGDNEKAIDYLNKIIHWKVDLRTDLQCYARLLHLIAHYELGNFDLLEYLTKSVYRFMAKMENLSLVEEEMFKFLRSAFQLSPKEIKPAFEKLLERIKRQENNRFETRAFQYLDVISWLESKIQGRQVQDVIREKYLERKKTSC
jgi:hypothetical protein